MVAFVSRFRPAARHITAAVVRHAGASGGAGLFGARRCAASQPDAGGRIGAVPHDGDSGTAGLDRPGHIDRAATQRIFCGAALTRGQHRRIARPPGPGRRRSRLARAAADAAVGPTKHRQADRLARPALSFHLRSIRWCAVPVSRLARLCAGVPAAAGGPALGARPP